MSQFQASSSSQSEFETQVVQTETVKIPVSVLRHLPEARRIMEGHNYQHQITKCIYQHPLGSNPAFIVPSSNNTQNFALANNRLIKMQEALFEHENMKQKIKIALQKQTKQINEINQTLWTTYAHLNPSYARFGNTSRKNNFANVMIPINGVNILLSNKAADKISENETRSLPMSPDTIRFDSHFQSGNLLYAYRKQCLEIQTYDLILQNDVNTKGHNQWFYFKIYNSKRHNKIRFNIVNLIKSQSMFSYGIKPLIFSERDYSRHRLGWVRDGEKIKYSENHIRRQSNGKSYYSLSFQYYFREVDTVYFAPTHPYTFTQLTQYFDNLIAQHSLSNFLSIKTVTQTIGRNSISVVTFGTGKKQIKDCNVAWILGRQHPGETTSSYMIQGILNRLVSIYSCPSPEMVPILDNLIFKIVPMINVDGVIHGNTRAQLTGVDPNRMWKKTIKRLSPSISAIKKLISQNKENVSLVLDMHSHSKKVGCFFYGNSVIYDPKSTKVYPTMVCQGDERFELKHCRFRGGYETTARSVLFYDLGIKQVYTVECSLLGYLKKNRITQYKINDYYEMGYKLIDTYIELEKAKTTREPKDIVDQLSDKMIDREDAESARSQSSLSDEQYQQIKTKVKKIKKKKPRRNENEVVTLTVDERKQGIENMKYYVKKNTRTNVRIEASFNDKKRKLHEGSNNDLQSKSNLIKNLQNRPLATRDNFGRKGGTLNVSEINPKIQNRRFGEKDTNDQRKGSGQISRAKLTRQHTSLEKKVYKHEKQKKQMEVQATIVDNGKFGQHKKVFSRVRKQNSLCIVGSSLQDDLIYINKNEVGIQLYDQLIDQAYASSTTQANKKSMKIKKMPKILNYLCSNLIGIQQENSVLPQDRRLAPLAAKKYVHSNKL